MALQVGELFASLSLNTDDFDKNLEKSEGKASKFGGVLQTALGFVAGGVITKGLDIVGSAVSGIADAMIGGNAEFEKYQTQFGVLLGSTDEAKKRLDELAKFGASTPFELPELVKADKVLTSFGIHSNDMLTIVGDVAAGTGASFEDMALLMGKFSAGSTGEVISRFQEMGIATKDELAKMGIEFNNAGSMTTPVAEAMPILEQIMKDKFGGMMAAQSSTFEGMVSNLQDWLGQTGRLIGQPIFEVLKDKLGVLLEFLNKPETQAAITAFATALADGIGTAITFLANDAIPALITVWNTLQPAIGAIIPIIQEIIGAFTSGGDSASGLGETVDWLKGIWESLQPVISAVTNVIQGIVTTVFGAIDEFLKQNGDDIKGFLQSTWTQIQGIIKVAVELINATIVPIFNAIASFIVAHKEQIVSVLTGAWNIIEGVVKVALSIIQGVISTVLAVIKGDWSGAWEAIKTMFSGVWDGIKLILTGALTIIKSELSMAWDAIKGVAQTAWNYLHDNIIQPVIDSITSTVENGIADVTGAFNGLLDDMRNIGANIVQGIQDGISSAWGSFMQWIRDKIAEIPEPIRTALGIGSPSKLMAQVVGIPIVQGILMGMKQELPNLLSYVEDVGDDILRTIDNITSQIDRVVLGGLQGTADINRQLARNLDDMKDFSPFLQTGIESALDQARLAMQQFTNPADQAAFFKMRSNQIFELAELQKKLEEEMVKDPTGKSEEAERLRRQMDLIEAAQDAERKAFDEKIKQQQTAYEALAQNVADALNQAFDPVLAELLRRFTEIVGLGYNVLIPPAPMPTNGFVGNTGNGGVMNGKPNVVFNQYVTQVVSNLDEMNMGLAHYAAMS